ncbi:hypothetical protein BKA62DRAFT_675061 [Auriculariales sp. MPI-PUGE-AT-0066]|nr:hypothetical protein BKA62DRAFT_675061 [Auriculariales sp. MPI-PUGE-AT-0066]
MGGVSSTLWAIQDYKAWKQVKGGFPLTPSVWAWTYYVQWKKYSKTALAHHRRLLASHVDRRQYLFELPKRGGPKPLEIKWPLPQRQLTQTITKPILEQLEGYFHSVAASNNIAIGPSIREMHTGWLCMLHDRRCGSIHVNMHPRDALLAIEAGWATPFALAICGTEPGPEYQIGISCVLVYAPRDGEDLAVVKRLVDAGVRFALNQLPELS